MNEITTNILEKVHFKKSLNPVVISLPMREELIYADSFIQCRLQLDPQAVPEYSRPLSIKHFGGFSGRKEAGRFPSTDRASVRGRGVRISWFDLLLEALSPCQCLVKAVIQIVQSR